MDVTRTGRSAADLRTCVIFLLFIVRTSDDMVVVCQSYVTIRLASDSCDCWLTVDRPMPGNGSLVLKVTGTELMMEVGALASRRVG